MTESEDSTVFENIKLKLKEHNIEYVHTHHEPVRTSEQAAQIRNSKLECGAKAIVMKSKDKEQIRFVLFVMSAVKKLDSKAVKKLLQVKSLSFATEEEVIKLTKCLPGAVPPFGSVLGLQCYMDESLRAVEWIDFNAGLRTDSAVQINYILFLNRQGKVRLAKWYNTFSQKDKNRIVREVSSAIPKRDRKQCNFFEYKEHVVAYRRYASVYFILGMDRTDNELLGLEVLHEFCVVLDKYFGSVCELDLVFYFDRVYTILDELIIAGELQEPSAEHVLKSMRDQDLEERSEMLEETMTYGYTDRVI